MKKTIIEDISIIMPVYNHELTIVDAIESVLMQKTNYNYTLHCINDASVDKSADILEHYAAQYPDKIKVYHNPYNMGSGKKAILYQNPSVKARYWCLLAGDDYWTSHEKLNKQINFLDNNADFVGCSCNTVLKNELTGKSSLIKPSKSSWNYLDIRLLKNKYSFYVHPSGIIWRNIFIKKNSFFPRAFKKDFAYGDVMLRHMMLLQGGKMHNIPEVMSCYRVTGRGVWSRNTVEQKSNANKILEEKLKSSVSLKYKILIYLQKYRSSSPFMKKIILGPINE
ncbi:glycosyltransferase family 2 protein [Legionella israelensis]|uniref:Glycosyltransferase family 2 protein n=1 Tax=Legionella israelensis TaxID=454 RepID=A0AAX1EI98_9GAMM|nr:glycosyltransferase family 2 protein [Legionella israelensis]QBR84519.1 glycosyltransferase family 2 protein [Legionella israelensis]